MTYPKNRTGGVAVIATLGMAVAAVTVCLRASSAQTTAPLRTGTVPAPSALASKKDIQESQQRLQALGYEPGPADGAMGAKTVAAFRKFQSDRSLPVTGVLDRKTLDELNLQVGPKPTGAQAREQAAALAQIVDTVSARDEYKSINLPEIIKTFDSNHDIAALAPLERQAVLDVLLDRVYMTSSASFKTPLDIAKVEGGYLTEDPKRRLSASGGTNMTLRDGTKIKLTLTGASVKPGGEVFQIGTGTEVPDSHSIAKDSIAVKGSLTISSALNDTIWIASTELPRDRIAMTGFIMGMSLAWPIGDGTIYGFRGRISGFLPGVTISTTNGQTAYFALVANMGLVYLAGEAIVSSTDHPARTQNCQYGKHLVLDAPRLSPWHGCPSDRRTNRVLEEKTYDISNQSELWRMKTGG